MIRHSSSGTLHKLSKKPPSYNYFDEPTIYAQIDHNYKKVPTESPFPPIIQSPNPPPQQTTPSSNNLYQKPFLREIVTIRTPLMFTQQESCV